MHVFLLALMLMVNFIKSKPNTYLVETEETTNAETGYSKIHKASLLLYRLTYISSGTGRRRGRHPLQSRHTV